MRRTPGRTWRSKFARRNLSLQSLQRILTHPPADNGGEILPRLEHLSIPSFVDLGRAA